MNQNTYVNIHIYTFKKIITHISDTLRIFCNTLSAKDKDQFVLLCFIEAYFSTAMLSKCTLKILNVNTLTRCSCNQVDTTPERIREFVPD